MSEAETMQRIFRTIAAALGRPFPQTERPPSRQELLDVAGLCAGAAEMAGALANEVERFEANANVIPFPGKDGAT